MLFKFCFHFLLITGISATACKPGWNDIEPITLGRSSTVSKPPHVHAPSSGRWSERTSTHFELSMKSTTTSASILSIPRNTSPKSPFVPPGMATIPDFPFNSYSTTATLRPNDPSSKLRSTSQVSSTMTSTLVGSSSTLSMNSKISSSRAISSSSGSSSRMRSTQSTSIITSSASSSQTTTTTTTFNSFSSSVTTTTSTSVFSSLATRISSYTTSVFATSTTSVSQFSSLTTAVVLSYSTISPTAFSTHVSSTVTPITLAVISTSSISSSVSSTTDANENNPLVSTITSSISSLSQPVPSTNTTPLYSSSTAEISTSTIVTSTNQFTTGSLTTSTYLSTSTTSAAQSSLTTTLPSSQKNSPHITLSTTTSSFSPPDNEAVSSTLSTDSSTSSRGLSSSLTTTTSSTATTALSTSSMDTTTTSSGASTSNSSAFGSTSSASSYLSIDSVKSATTSSFSTVSDTTSISSSILSTSASETPILSTFSSSITTSSIFTTISVGTTTTFPDSTTVSFDPDSSSCTYTVTASPTSCYSLSTPLSQLDAYTITPTSNNTIPQDFTWYTDKDGTSASVLQIKVDDGTGIILDISDPSHLVFHTDDGDSLSTVMLDSHGIHVYPSDCSVEHTITSHDLLAALGGNASSAPKYRRSIMSTKRLNKRDLVPFFMNVHVLNQCGEGTALYTPSVACGQNTCSVSPSLFPGGFTAACQFDTDSNDMQTCLANVEDTVNAMSDIVLKPASGTLPKYVGIKDVLAAAGIAILAIPLIEITPAVAAIEFLALELGIGLVDSTAIASMMVRLASLTTKAAGVFEFLDTATSAAKNIGAAVDLGVCYAKYGDEQAQWPIVANIPGVTDAQTFFTMSKTPSVLDETPSGTLSINDPAVTTCTPKQNLFTNPGFDAVGSDGYLTYLPWGVSTNVTHTVADKQNGYASLLLPAFESYDFSTYPRSSVWQTNLSLTFGSTYAVSFWSKLEPSMSLHPEYTACALLVFLNIFNLNQQLYRFDVTDPVNFQWTEHNFVLALDDSLVGLHEYYGYLYAPPWNLEWEWRCGRTMDVSTLGFTQVGAVLAVDNFKLWKAGI